jgi:hypothetical protein
LTPGNRAFADALAAGHAVHTPDLFDGRSWSIDEGLGYIEDGSEAMQEPASARRRPAAGLCTGFSFGVHRSRPEARHRGALLLYPAPGQR